MNAAANPFHNKLHDAEIIEDRHKAGEEDDHGQRGNGKAKPAQFRLGEITKQKVHTGTCIAQQIADPLGHGLDDEFAGGHIENQNRNERLKTKGRPHDAWANGPAVR